MYATDLQACCCTQHQPYPPQASHHALSYHALGYHALSYHALSDHAFRQPAVPSAGQSIAHYTLQNIDDQTQKKITNVFGTPIIFVQISILLLKFQFLLEKLGTKKPLLN